jgi:hypothetical protein
VRPIGSGQAPRRPRIRLTNNLSCRLFYWNLDKPITYFGRTVAVANTWARPEAITELSVPRMAASR